MSIEQAFSSFPDLYTARLHLRQILPTDAEAYFAIKSDLEVTRHYAQEPHLSIEQTRAWIDRQHQYFANREAIPWVFSLKGEARMIGGVVFWNFDPGFHCAEIGYEMHPAYHKQGIMREAVAAILKYGFEELKLHRIEACPSAENAPSRNLLLKLGFSLEGNLRQRLYFREHYADQLYFGLLQTEYSPQS